MKKLWEQVKELEDNLDANFARAEAYTKLVDILELEPVGGWDKILEVVQRTKAVVDESIIRSGVAQEERDKYRVSYENARDDANRLRKEKEALAMEVARLREQVRDMRIAKEPVVFKDNHFGPFSVGVPGYKPWAEGMKTIENAREALTSARELGLTGAVIYDGRGNRLPI